MDQNYKTYAELSQELQFKKPEAPLTPQLEPILQAQPVDIPPPGKGLKFH